MRVASLCSVCLAVSVLGCSSSSTSSGGAGGSSDPFAGSFTCTGNVSLNFTQPAGVQPYMGGTSRTVTIKDNGDGTFTALSADDAGATCTLKASYSGNTATLEKGQSCTDKGLTISYTSATASATNGGYTAQYAFTFSGTITVTNDGGSQQVSVTGTGSETDTCTKS